MPITLEEAVAKYKEAFLTEGCEKAELVKQEYSALHEGFEKLCNALCVMLRARQIIQERYGTTIRFAK